MLTKLGHLLNQIIYDILEPNLFGYGSTWVDVNMPHKLHFALLELSSTVRRRVATMRRT